MLMNVVEGSGDRHEARRWDFFVSYVAQDRGWAEWIAWYLEESGYRVTLRAWDLPPGSNRQRYLFDALHDAERLIAVVSRAYLASSTRLQELLTATAADPGGRGRRVVPIRIDDADVPDLVGTLEDIELHGLSESDALGRLLRRIDAAVAGRVKPAAPPAFPGPDRRVLARQSLAMPGGRSPAAAADADAVPVAPNATDDPSPGRETPDPATPGPARGPGAAPGADGSSRTRRRRRAEPPLAVVAHAGPLRRASRLFWIGALAFTGDAALLVTGADDGRTRLWDVRNPTAPRRVAGFHDHTDWVRAIAVDAHRGLVASAGTDGTIVVRSARHPTAAAPLASFPAGTDRAWATAFTPDGARLAVGGIEGHLRVWDLDDLSAPRPIVDLPGHRGSVGAVVFPSRRVLVSAGQDATVLMWRLDRDGALPEPVRLAGQDGDVWALAFASAGRLLAAGSDEASISLWRLEASDHPPVQVARIDAHQGRIRAVSFSPDGTLLASGSDDNAVRVWDVRRPDLPNPAAVLSPAGGRVTSLAFSPRGDVLAAGSSDGCLRLYHVAGITGGTPVDA